MADDEHRRPGRLGETHQSRRAFPQLRDAAGAGVDLRQGHRLDRIDDQQRGTERACRREDPLEVGLGSDPQAGRFEAEPLGTQPDLIDRLLAARVEHRGVCGDLCRHLQQQRRLADAGVTPQKRDATRDDATAQDPVEFS